MITNATIDSVSILEVRDDGNWRRAYFNSEVGRAQLQEEFPEEFEELCGEGKMWGTAPTVFPVADIEVERDETPTQLDLLEAQVTYTAMMTNTLLEV